MNRREALAATAALLGTTIIGADVFLTGCTRREETRNFDPQMVSLLNDIGDAILPTTTLSPGAGSCNIGHFMNVMVTDCYSPEDQKIFFDGISKLEDMVFKQFGKKFQQLDDAQRHEVLVSLDKEAQLHEQANEKPAHFFTMLHQLTVWGYFTSEPGATQALRYIPIPGRYEGCIPYKGEPAWIY